MCYLNITFCNESCSYEYEFPSADAAVIPHTIVYDTFETVGVYEEMMGLSIIPSCTDKCIPHIKWYHDGDFYKEGYMLYYINVLQNGKYSCVITCTHKTNTSSEIYFKVFDEVENDNNLLQSVEVNLSVEICTEQKHKKYKCKCVFGMTLRIP